MAYPGFNDARIALYKRNWKAYTFIGFNRLVGEAKRLCQDDNEAIEIYSLHSVQKGEAYTIMKKVVDLVKRMGIPAMLYTETEENVKYFERYGFQNHGQLGTENEYLMILHP